MLSGKRHLLAGDLNGSIVPFSGSFAQVSDWFHQTLFPVA